MTLAPTSRLHWAGTYDGTLDYEAGSVVLQGGILYHARLLRARGSAAPAGDPTHWDALLPGAPTLYGPYVVEYTDIPHDGNTKTLWTPQVGDVILRLFADWQRVTVWDHGANLWLGQNVDGAAGKNSLMAFDATDIDRAAGSICDLGVNLVPTQAGAYDAGSAAWYASAYVCHTDAPLQVQLVSGDADPTQGHVELYALLARAVAP